jgi:hypothetical protein
LYRAAPAPAPTTEKKSHEANPEETNDDDDDYGNVAPTDNAYDQDDSDEDDDDDEEEEVASAKLSSQSTSQGNITSQAARNHVFPMLVTELVKESIMSSADGKVLLQAFSKGNEVVNAALDVYDLDSDMGELVDTLQRFARAASAMN